MKIIIIIVLSLLHLSVLAQDIIITRKGEEISVKVIEISPSLIKYKKYNNLEGPIYSMQKDDVFMINYKNGTKDIFNLENSSAPNEDQKTVNQNRKTYDINTNLLNYKKVYKKPYILYDFQFDITKVFDSKSITYYGLDYSGFSLVNGVWDGKEQQLTNLFSEWNEFFDEFLPPKQIKKYLRIKSVNYKNSSISTSYKSLSTPWISSIPHNIQIEEVLDIVNNYKTISKTSTGIGLVIIVESFNYETGMVTAIPTFFDIKTRDVIWATKIQEKTGNPDNRNRWAYGLMRVFKTFINKIYEPQRTIFVQRNSPF